MLRELGSRLAEGKVIPTADDIFWVTNDEILVIAAQLDAGMPVESWRKDPATESGIRAGARQPANGASAGKYLVV
jgi:hypothetical protein